MTPEDQEKIALLTKHATQLDLVNQQLTVTTEYLSALVVMIGFIAIVVAFLAGFLLTKGRR